MSTTDRMVSLRAATHWLARQHRATDDQACVKTKRAHSKSSHEPEDVRMPKTQANRSVTPSPSTQSATTDVLAGLTQDAGRAYQENLRLYGEVKARAMHDVSLQNIAAVNALLQAVKHEGSINAIDAGRMVVEWRNHIGPVLRAAYDGAGGEP